MENSIGDNMKKILLAVIMIIGSKAWAVDTYTTNLHLTKPGPSSLNWAGKINGDFDILDSTIGTISISTGAIQSDIAIEVSDRQQADLAIGLSTGTNYAAINSTAIALTNEIINRQQADLLLIPSSATGTYPLSISGNANTSTALTVSPGGCIAGQYVSSITANGTLTCGTPSGAGDVLYAASGTFTGANIFSSATINNATVNYSTVSQTTQGFSMLPNGMIMQWGLGIMSTNVDGTKLTITFNKAFPNAILSVITTKILPSDGYTAMEYPVLSVSTSSIIIREGNPGNAYVGTQFYWLAIGY